MYLQSRYFLEIKNIRNINVTTLILRSCDRASWQIFIIKSTRCTNFSNLFWNETLHVSDSSSVHHQEFFNINTGMVYVIQVCWQLSRRIRNLLESCQQICMTYTIAVCTVKNSLCWTEELSETCRVSFQNKFEKLMHLVFFYYKYNHTNTTTAVGVWKCMQPSFQSPSYL